MTAMSKPSSAATIEVDPLFAAFDAAPLDPDALTADEAEALDRQVGAAEASSPKPRSTAEVAAEIAAHASREG